MSAELFKTNGFLSYKPENLDKINALRRVLSKPDAKLPPILNNGQVSFSSAESAKNEPRSCSNCAFYNYGRTCQLMGKGIEIRKFIWPKQATRDSKRIEYWPVCSMWLYGEPNTGAERFIAAANPDDAGLIWINAPEVGQEMSGSCCGGQNGGDDCDYYMTKGPDKRAEDTAFCRVLQRQVNSMDCCTAWQDDDRVSWQDAQERLRVNDGR